MQISKFNYKKTISYITKPMNLGPIAFSVTGIGKTLKDYSESCEEKKQRVLLKDSSMLLGSVLAFALISPFTRKLCKAKAFSKLAKFGKKSIACFFKKDLNQTKIINETKKVVEHTERIVNQSCASTINTFSAILGAVGANELVYKYVFSKKSFIKEPKEKPADIEEALPLLTANRLTQERIKHIQNIKNGYYKATKVFQNFDYATPDKVKEASDRIWSTISDIPDMHLISAPMIALTGFSIANTKGYENKIKKTTHELIANTFIPTAFITAVSIAVENQKTYIKYPALFVGLLTGSFAGKFSAEKVNNFINKKFIPISEKNIIE